TISLLIEQFNRNNTGYGVKKRIAQILSRMKKEESVKNFFISKLDYPEDSIRNIIYKFLNNVDFKSPPGKINEILNIIDGEIKSIVFNIAALEDIKNDSEYKVLTRAIEYDVFSKTEKIFFLLSFIYQRELITSAKTNFMSESREKKIYALEIIDNILSNDLKNKFFPVIDELSNDQRLKKMTVFYPVEQLPKIEKLKKIITGNKDTYSFWTRTCAVYIAGKFALKDFYQPVIDALNDDSSIVRETAVWAFGRLNPSDLIERLQMLLKDESAIVSDIAGYVIETVGLAQLKIKKQYLTKTGECETGLFVTIVENENESRARRCRAARQLANIESDESKKSLFKMLAVEDETILSEVLKSLVFSGFEINSEAKKQLLKLVNSEFEDIENTLRLIAVFKGKDEYNELYSALKIEILRNCERIISIISLLNGKNNYKDLYFWFIENRLINYNIPDKMLNLLKKYLEFVSDENVKNTIYCLLTTYSFSKLFEKLNVTSDLIKEPLKKSLELIAFGSEKWLRSWTRAVAIRIVGNLEFKEYVPKIVVLMKDPDFIIRETAVMVLHKLDKPVYENYKHDLKNDLNPNIRKIIRELE
ncbi:hypothetical protein KA977_14130, partial [Candidatus Dependentiae bacterium]|nr:hypothetical protein [Candidatus Dependentiae bacterium]